MSKEIEHVLLGSLILNPGLLAVSDIKGDDFSGPRERQIFGLICQLWEESRPKEIDVAVLYSRATGDGMGAYISSLLTGAVRIEPAVFRKRLSELRKKTKTTEILAKIERQAKNGELNLEVVLPDIDAYRQLETSDISFALRSGAELEQTNLQVEWALERLIPERAITIVSAPGGTGKTFISLQIANAFCTGEPVWGLQTKRKVCVYIDFENPLPLLVERIKALQVKDVLFWTLGSEPKPPLLDSESWNLYFNLPKESVLFFDSLRASHSADENSSQDMALILYRLKLLREAGFTINVLHHTPKGKDQIYKGSTAISDLADQTLNLYITNKDPENFNLSLAGEDALFYFGTGPKSRYEHYSIFLRFNGTIFELAEHPDEEKLRAIHEFLLLNGPKSQTEVRKFISTELDLNRTSSVLRLLEKGEGHFLYSTREAKNKPRIYYPVAGNAKKKREIF